ncbi:hypothetical protein RFI_09919 [Reticulomyxa filosa]|uniref:Uncharacterized protein n=1 Tax=Reticulomyxa filosa TaxID=46433 RepID=X6NMQ2_RETFI|nr:hypothetical protein RFI_09919 [Reticulomyxa filosa]|eukprot:ETO27213.1 hypothetical protein RFI_09919 [Reticulomyxa filosa]
MQTFMVKQKKKKKKGVFFIGCVCGEKKKKKKKGFRFFAVDRTTYLTLQYLNYQVQSEFPMLHSLCVMYNGKLIWSGLSQEDMRALYTNNQEPNIAFMYSFMSKYQQLCTEEYYKEKYKEEMSINTDGVTTPVSSVADKDTRQSNEANEGEMDDHIQPPLVKDTSRGVDESFQTPKSVASTVDLEKQRSFPINQHSVRRASRNPLLPEMKGTFVTGPCADEYYSEETPVVYISNDRKFYRLIVYKYNKLFFFWLMDDPSLLQPVNVGEDVFDGLIKKLRLNNNQSDNDNDNEHENDDNDSGNEVPQGKECCSQLNSFYFLSSKAFFFSFNPNGNTVPNLGPLGDDVNRTYFKKQQEMIRENEKKRKDSDIESNVLVPQYLSLKDQSGSKTAALNSSTSSRERQTAENIIRERRHLREKRIQFYVRLQKFVEPKTEEIAKELEQHENRQNRRQARHTGAPSARNVHNAAGGTAGGGNTPNAQTALSATKSSNFRYLYFNHQNLALKSVLKAPGKKLSSDTCRTLRNIHADFEQFSFLFCILIFCLTKLLQIPEKDKNNRAKYSGHQVQYQKCAPRHPMAGWWLGNRILLDESCIYLLTIQKRHISRNYKVLILKILHIQLFSFLLHSYHTFFTQIHRPHGQIRARVFQQYFYAVS